MIDLSLSTFGNLVVVRSLLGLGVLAAVLLVDRMLRGRLSPNARFVLFFGVLLSFVVPPLWNVVLPDSAPQVLAMVSVSPAESVSSDAAAVARPVVRLEPRERSQAGFWSFALVLGCAYALGVCFALALLLRRLSKAHRLVRNAEPGPSSGVYWADVSGPCVLGLVRPRILLPRSFVALAADKLAMVLRHERQHIKRGDLWTRLIQNLIQVVFWFHPGVWWLNRRIDDLREMAVDAALLRSGAVRRQDYCELLLELASKASGLAPRWGLAMAGSPRMTKRITACLQPVKRGQRGWMLVWMLPLAAFLLPGGCSSTPKPTASIPAAMKSGLSPFELSPPPAMPTRGKDQLGAVVDKSKTQIELRSWFLEVPTGVLDQLDAIDEDALKALRYFEGVDILSAPRIVTHSGVPATIEIGREVVSSIDEDDVELEFVGVRLEALPTFDMAQSQPITLQVQAMISEPATAEELQSKGLAVTEPEIPVAYRSVAKTLSVADGGFAEIGRIQKMHTTHVEDRIPLLGDIPGVGRLFRNESVVHEKRDLLILVSPRLVDRSGVPIKESSILDKNLSGDPFDPSE